MSELLKPKQKVRTEGSRETLQIEEFLGGGGQGEVYRASHGGQPVALKWYFPESATPEQRAALDVIIEHPAPNQCFLWPLELVSDDKTPGFGYIMALREGRFHGIADLMKRRVEPTFRCLARSGRDLAHSYFLLHAEGLCYRDISFGNVFFDPGTGEIRICDNDNVAVNGNSRGGVLGTPKFMAPEIVTGKALPSAQSDLYSLSVLLFYMLMMAHPLDGQREAAIHSLDPAAMYRLYGTDPLFIFDRHDQSNEPVAGYHDNAIIFWPIYPKYVRDKFAQSFTEGITDPDHGRVAESVWRSTLAALDDAIFYCSQCGAENFYDAEALRASDGHPGACWACKASPHLPPRLRIGSSVIMLNHDTILYNHHVDSRSRFDFSTHVGEVNRHPTNPDLWGLKNNSSEKWVAVGSDGITRDVDPGRSISLATGTKLYFGTTEGEIRT